MHLFPLVQSTDLHFDGFFYNFFFKVDLILERIIIFLGFARYLEPTNMVYH